jgi:hypothetical protein
VQQSLAQCGFICTYIFFNCKLTVHAEPFGYAQLSLCPAHFLEKRMRTIINAFLVMLGLLLSTVSGAENRAVDININGIGPGVDGAVLTTLQQVIGHAVANGVIDKFIVNGYGKEGGFFACAQAAPRSKAFGSFIKQLRSLSPDPNTTAYSVTLAVSCPTPTEPVVCTMDVKACPDGSFVSRVAPSCAFSPCPGK